MVPTLLRMLSTSTEIMSTQESLWRETLAETPAIEEDARRGGHTTTKPINSKMLHDIQMAVSKLAAKAAQLIDNETTNLAESWMHVRMKFDGGKNIHRGQNGVWQHRCMGAGLQHNLGKEWGPPAWSKMTSTPPNRLQWLNN